VSQRKRSRRPPGGVQGLRIVDRLLGCPPEDLDLAAGRRLLLRRGVDLLEHARHGEDQRRLEGAHVSHQLGGVRAEAHDGTRRHERHLDQPGERVRQRQEHHRRGTLLEQNVLQNFLDARDVDGEITVSEAHALGAAGGS